MKKPPLIALGGFFIVWSMIGFLIPIADNGWSPLTFVQLCGIDIGPEEVISERFGPCQMSSYLMAHNYAYLATGIGLIFVPVVDFKKN